MVHSYSSSASIAFTMLVILMSTVRGAILELIMFGLIGTVLSTCLTAVLLPKGRTLESDNQCIMDKNYDFDIESVILYLRNRQATEGPNKFNALHGILTVMGVPKLTVPNLSLIQRLLYHRLFCDLVGWKSAFVILLLDTGKHINTASRQIYSAPSWVPDWSQLPERSTKSMDWYYFYNIREPRI